MKYNIMIVILFFLIFNITIESCTSKNSSSIEAEYFCNLTAVPIIKAIIEKDTDQIKNLSNSIDINSIDTVDGTTLLMFAIDNDLYESAEALLKLGANGYIKPFMYIKNGIENSGLPHQQNRTAMHRAASNIATSKYVDLLLKYGVKDFSNCDTNDSDHGESALAIAASSNFNSFKLMVEAGANPYFFCKKHSSFLFRALLKNIQIVRYLVIEKGVNVINPIYYNIDGKAFYFISELRLLDYKLDSYDYKIKMEIVKFVKNKYNLDYFKEPIPEKIRKKYTTDYLEKY